MNKKWIFIGLCSIVLISALLGQNLWQDPATTSLEDFLADTPMEGDPMEYYVLKEVNDAINVPATYPSVTAKSGSNLVLGGAKYSTNNGTTWNDATGNSVRGETVYYEGNNVWKVIDHGDGTYQVWKSTDNGASFATYGIEIDLTGLAGYVSSANMGIIANTGDVTTCLVLFLWRDGTQMNIRGVKWNTGTSTWDLSTNYATGTLGYQYTQKNNVVWDTTNGVAYFLLAKSIPLSWTDYATEIYQWEAGAPDTITAIHNFIDISGTDNFVVSVVGKLIQNSSGYYFISGNLYSDAGVQGLGRIYRSDPHNLTIWTLVWQSNDTTVPYIIEGTAPRMWCVSGQNVYLSHTNGMNFFPIAHDAFDISNNSYVPTWVGGIEYTSSDRGFGAFDDAHWYIFQEATWTDIFAEESLKVYAGSEPGIFKGLMDSNDKTRFVDGMVLCIFDGQGNILFEGKIAFTEQDEGLLSFQAVEISEELERIKPTGTYTAQTAAQILVAMINANCTFCYQSSSITSSATVYTIDFKGEKSLAQILDEFANLEDYIWYKAGDGKITFDDGTTASGTSYDATTADFAVPKISSEGYRIANRIEGRGKVEADGPVFYPADDLDDQTRNGVWVFKFTQPTWGYDEVKACADNMLAARKSWSNILSMLVNESLSLRPGTTVGMSNFSDEYGIDDGNYIIMAINHLGDGTSHIVLNNASISSKDWAREQEYAANAMKDLYTKADIAESGGSSTDIPFESEDEMLARIFRHATSEANAITLIYDSTHSVKLWIDSDGSLQVKPTAALGTVVFNKATGTMWFYIKATGGAGTEDVWLYLDAEDDSGLIFQENGTMKAYIEWNKGNADLNIQSDGDIVLNPTGVVTLTGDVAFAANKGITGEGIPPCQILQGEAGFVAGTNLFYADLSDNNANINTCFYVAKGGSFKVRFLYEVTNAETVSGLLYLGDATSGQDITWDLANGVNCDLTAAVANVMYPFDSGAYTIADGALVTFKWAKDAAGTAGKYIYIYGMVLIRQ